MSVSTHTWRRSIDVRAERAERAEARTPQRRPHDHAPVRQPEKPADGQMVIDRAAEATSRRPILTRASCKPAGDVPATSPVPSKQDCRGRACRDPILARHCVVLASVVGAKRAEEITGVHRTTICRWRVRIEAETGERFPRIHNRGNTGHGKLSLAKARELRARRARGVSWGVLARIYRVSIRTCRFVWDGKLYPDPTS